MDFSIIIVNWNANNFLKRCLLSINQVSKLNYFVYEVIVVDNASDNFDSKIFKTMFPFVTFIINKNNLGYAKACNQGILQSHGQYVVLLNPDTIFVNDVLFEFMNLFNTDENIGIIGPKLITKENNLQHWARGKMLSLRSVINHYFLLSIIFSKNPFFSGFIDNNNYLDITEMGWVSGACIAIQRNIFNHIGFLDESFYMYSEDMDLCYRVNQFGYKIVYNPKAIVKHFISQSFKKQNSQEVLETPLRSQDLFFKKVYGGKRLNLFRTVVFLGLIIQLIIKYIIHVYQYSKDTKYRFNEVRRNMLIALKLMKKN